MSAHRLIWASLPSSAKDYRNWWNFDEVLTKTILRRFFLRHGVDQSAVAPVTFHNAPSSLPSFDHGPRANGRTVELRCYIFHSRRRRLLGLFLLMHAASANKENPFRHAMPPTERFSARNVRLDTVLRHITTRNVPCTRRLAMFEFLFILVWISFFLIVFFEDRLYTNKIVFQSKMCVFSCSRISRLCTRDLDLGRVTLT